MMSTAITGLFPLPNLPSDSASVGINTGDRLQVATGECGTTPLGPPGGGISNTPLGMRAPRRSNEFGCHQASPAAGFSASGY